MDKLESLSSTLQNITLYDIKSMYNQVSGACLCIIVLTVWSLGEECRPER